MRALTRAPGRGRLHQRVFLLNALIFVTATLALVVTPATISFPVELTEAIVLVVGLTAILVVNAVALRAAFAPLERLTRLMREIDPHRPGMRLPASGPGEVRELVLVFNDMLDRLEHERRDSARRELAAQEKERGRIAHELHDEIGQILTGALLRLETLSRSATPEQLANLRATQDSIRAAIDQLSSVVRQLRPEALTELGLEQALAALTSRLQDESGVPIRYRPSRRALDLGEERELVVYRVAQESLTNAVRHANATRVDLSLEPLHDHVLLTVTDDGRGLPNVPTTRYGILGMRERALLIGATLSVADGPTGGVTVTLAVPTTP